MPLVKLSPKQRVELRTALISAFATEGDLWDLLADPLNKDYKDYVGNNGLYREKVGDLLRGAENDDWVFDLILAAAQARPSDPELDRLAQTFKPVAVAAHLDQYGTCRLSGDYLLFNRASLRNAVRDQLNNVIGKRILVVQDESPPPQGETRRTKTGKSHTIQYISYLCQVQGGFDYAYIDLESLDQRITGITGEESSARIQPIDLAAQLVRKIGLGDELLPTIPNDAQWSSWVLTCCDNIEAGLRRKGGNWWIVIDAFNAVLLPQQTLDMVKELAVRISISLPKVRLILLGYSDSFPPDKVMPHVETERLKSALSQNDAIKDMSDFFKRASQELGIELTSKLVGGFVAETLQSIDTQEAIIVQTLAPRLLSCLLRLSSANSKVIAYMETEQMKRALSYEDAIREITAFYVQAAHELEIEPTSELVGGFVAETLQSIDPQEAIVVQTLAPHLLSCLLRMFWVKSKGVSK